MIPRKGTHKGSLIRLKHHIHQYHLRCHIWQEKANSVDLYKLIIELIVFAAATTQFQQSSPNGLYSYQTCGAGDEELRQQ